MNRRNILRGVVQSNLSAPPAALISHAVLCCIFAVSLSIIHETQIPFTFFRDFLKKFSEPSQSKPDGFASSPKGRANCGSTFSGIYRPKTCPKLLFPLQMRWLPPRGSCRANARLRGRTPTKKRPHHSKEQWGRFVLLQWVPLTQPWGPREPLPPQPLRRALPERQEQQRASEPASPRAWGDSDRPSAGRG